MDALSAPLMILSPDEAAEACPGEWPAGAWLVVTPGRDGAPPSWETGTEGDVADIARGRPAWPPHSGLRAVPPDPAYEIVVMDMLATSPGIADMARASLARQSGEARAGPDPDPDPGWD